MDNNQIKLVQQSFAKVEPIAEKAAEIFYVELFKLDPSLKFLFKSDMKEQGKKLMASISMVVKSLNDLGKILPAVEEMARRHVGYGVKAQDYETVGRALITTLGIGLGPSFTEEVKNAWIAAYSNLSGAMIKAAY